MDLKLVLRGLMLAVGLTVASFSGQHVDAAVLNLTTNPNSIGYIPGSGPSTTVTLSAGGFGRGFNQFNDDTGKDLESSPGLLGWKEVAGGTVIDASLSFSSNLPITPTENGDKFYAFYLMDAGLNYFGWVKMNLGGPGGAVSYLGAAFQTDAGGPILAGETAGGAGAVPEPTTAAIFGLATLVAGARGLKSRRKAQVAS